MNFYRQTIASAPPNSNVCCLRSERLITIQGAYTSLTDRIASYIQVATESASRFSLNDLFQIAGSDVSDRAVKETWAHGPIRLDDCGNPRRIALGRFETGLAKMSSEMLHNSSQLCGT